MLAAFLLAQFEARDYIQTQRRRLWEFYAAHLRDWANQYRVSLPSIPAHCEQPYHMFYMLMPSLTARQALIDHLKTRGILTVFHYLPLHLSVMGRRFGGQPGDCPVTESVSDRLVRLPFYIGLSEADQARVVAAILECPVL